jgi:PadR family transcriptional regulator, regulatory protein AphA
VPAMPPRVRTPAETRTLTTTEAAVLALLAIEGERSGYDLLKLVGQAIAYVWAPARSQLYTILPRLAAAGLAEVRHVRQDQRPDKQLYRITEEGRSVLAAWHETVEPDANEHALLKLFVGGLTTDANLIEHVEQFRRQASARLAELRAIEPTNTRRGHDRYHYFLLRLGIERRELDLRWADWVLSELRGAR